MKKTNKLWELFSTTFLISASTSGGYAIISIMKDKFVNKYNWLSEDEMLDLLAIAQSTPGAVAINTSVLVGYRIAGFMGALVTILGTTLPPLIIMSLVANFYVFVADNQIIRYLMHGMQAGVAALLVSVTIDLFSNITKQHSFISYLLVIISFVLARYTDINYLLIAFICAFAGIIKVLMVKKELK